ncbi:MAG: hypothetical protein HC850_01410 [Rhodomicrobium sp.]|nr:hypothetical protein [Rhodomicrobium sp.]
MPNYRGNFVSMDAAGAWHKPADGPALAYGAAAALSAEPAADCSRASIVHYARQAPSAFEAGQKGSLYGVRTHTPETRAATRYWDMPGFNSCALVVYAILKKAGCDWAQYTANAKAIYDMAYRSGWRPAKTQEGGCMVAWNSKWEGERSKIGDVQKQTKTGRTRFRHVGITTGSWLVVDNNSWLSRPTTFIAYRPIVYEPPIFLCPPEPVNADKAEMRQDKEIACRAEQSLLFCYNLRQFGACRQRAAKLFQGYSC